jgi:2-hydroxychromene-2-carboxylate isomerase
MARVEFWYEFASTYSYPAAARIERLANAAGVEVTWRPFLLGPIFQRQGWNDSPFNLHPAKGRYMWRDLERICAREGLPFARPSRFPRNGLMAARIAAAADPWCAEFTRRVYHANFAEDREISEPAVLAAILDAIGEPSANVLAHAQSDEAKQRLRAQTDAAAAIGIFGAPSFVVDGELFWGNDRLEQAIDFATNR